MRAALVIHQTDLIFRWSPFVVPRMQHLYSAGYGREAFGTLSTMTQQQQKWHNYTDTEVSTEKVSLDTFLL